MPPRSDALLVGLGTVAVCSVASVRIAVRHAWRGRLRYRDRPYEDRDGQSTTQDMLAFSTSNARFFVLFSCLFGFALSAGLLLRATNETELSVAIDTWLSTAAWALFMVQGICIAICHDPVLSYNMGLYLTISGLVYGLTLLSHAQKHVGQPSTGGGPWSESGLTALQGLAIMLTVVSGASLPRRPSVYFNGHKVDDMYSATLLSRLTWNWAWGLPMFVQRLPKINFDHMPLLPHWTRARDTAIVWNSLTTKTSLARALARLYWKQVAIQWTFGVLQGSSSFVIYWTTLKLLKTLESLPVGHSIPQSVWLLVAWMGLASMGGEWVEQYIHWLGWGELNNCVRAQIPAIMFEKLMRRKNAEGGSRVTSDGHPSDVDVAKSRKAIEHLFSSDVLSIADFMGRQELGALTASKLLVSLAFLVRLIGWIPLCAGLCSWAVILPFGMYASKRYSKARREWVKIRDRKQAILSETVNGLRQVKFSASEPQWEERIMTVREEELEALWRLSIANTLNTTFWMSGPIALAAVGLAVYATIHGTLLPSLTFVSLTAFRRLEGSISMVPDLVMDFITFAISAARIEQYLGSPELGPVVTTEDDCSHLAFVDATLAWPVDELSCQPEEGGRFMLRDINLKFPLNELSVICGKTGSGKTLLLEGLLGEVDLLSGSIRVPRAPSASERRDDLANPENWIVPGATAFVGQSPWIENATVKANILFGLPMQPERYTATLSACALTRDLEVLPDGDETELGVNGINLSGGQKWRVSLARAVYSRAGILVMDDIFSAVDAHVGRHVLENCIGGAICRGRTVIIATHHVGICLPKARAIVELADGAARMVMPSSDATYGDQNPTFSHHIGIGGVSVDSLSTPSVDGGSRVGDARNRLFPDTEPTNPAMASGPVERPKARRQFIHAEDRPEGAVNRSIYKSYLSAVGKHWLMWWGMVLFSCVALQFIVMSRSWWLKIWSSRSWPSETSTPATVSLTTQDDGDFRVGNIVGVFGVGNLDRDPDLNFYLAMYLGISVCAIVASALRLLYILFVGLRSGRTLFMQLTRAVLRAPLLWIDTTPAARILNRLVIDSAAVDRSLMTEFGKLAAHALNIVGILAAAWFVSPYFMLLAALCMLAAFFLARYHIVTKRPVKRLESVARSPIFGLFASGLSGITTIRAYDRTTAYIATAYQTIDVYISCSWHLHINNHWLGLGMGMIGVFFTVAVAVFALIKHVDAALAGFALSFAVEFSSAAMWGIRTFVSLENNMNAMERVVEYSEIETEPKAGSPPPAAWPTEGRVEVDNLVVAYAPDLPPVLRGLTFDVKGGERIGVVGRTGAGKSSLTLALFRLLEARSGSIRIDGLDIASLTLHHLRSRLTIIPQDPLLFSGTIRSNLDPLDQHSDDALLDALHRVRLLPESQDELVSTDGSSSCGSSSSSLDGSVGGMFGDLASIVSEGGVNLSHGQRQLLCLARAIVERPRIMLLDEATSAVDMATDHLIQRSIRDEFSACTLIVIAHRLSTIIDFDRILVLDEGEVAEFGSPKELWQKDGGMFRVLCEKSGERDHLAQMIHNTLPASPS